MEDEALVAYFMEVTGCGSEDAFHHLASNGGHIGRAFNSFFNVAAGPSGSRSPPPSPRASVSETEEDEEDAVPAPVPAARRDGRRSRPGYSGSSSRTRRVSWWDDSETRVESSRRRRACEGGIGTAGGVREVDAGNHSRRRVRHFRDIFDSDDEINEVEGNNSRRRRRRLNPTVLSSEGGDKKAEDDNNSRRRRRSREGGIGTAGDVREVDAGNHSRRRVRRFRDTFGSDDEIKPKEVEGNNSHRRRRFNPKELSSEGGDKKAEDDNNSSRRCRRRFREHVSSSSSDADDDGDDDMNMDMEVDEAPRPPPRNKTFEDLFKVPHELTYKGGFHGAKAHAARQARWLLANVQSCSDLPLPSLHQNRDLWGNDMVAQCVRDHFVLWQADVDDQGEGEEEAKKVAGYYNIPRDKLPAVVVVDPVTGLAMDTLHGSAAYDLNDFLVRVGPYTDMKPIIPAIANMKQKKDIKPAATVATTDDARRTTSSERARLTRQEEAPMTMRKPVTVVAEAAAAPTGHHEQQPASVEKVCKLRVRLPDGRVVTKEFESQCAVSALFAYCRSELGGATTTEKPPFRLLRFVGYATEEIGNQNASFQSLGLHLTTVSVHL